MCQVWYWLYRFLMFAFFLTFYTHTSTDSQEIPYTVQIVVGCPLGVPISYYIISIGHSLWTSGSKKYDNSSCALSFFKNHLYRKLLSGIHVPSECQTVWIRSGPTFLSQYWASKDHVSLQNTQTHQSVCRSHKQRTVWMYIKTHFNFNYCIKTLVARY